MSVGFRSGRVLLIVPVRKGRGNAEALAGNFRGGHMKAQVFAAVLTSMVGAVSIHTLRARRGHGSVAANRLCGASLRASRRKLPACRAHCYQWSVRSVVDAASPALPSQEAAPLALSDRLIFSAVRIGTLFRGGR